MTYNLPKFKSFRFWCQKVLPLVYDNSLSYYEVLSKVVHYLNLESDAINEIVDILEGSGIDIDEAVAKVIEQLEEDGTITDAAEDALDELIESGGIDARVELVVNSMITDGDFDEKIESVFDTMTASDSFESLINSLTNHKEWSFQSLSLASADENVQVLDTITTNSAVYLVVSSGGITVGGKHYIPVMYTKATDLGLVANGSTDDSANLATALALINVVDLHGANVRLNDSVSVPSNKTLRNGTITMGNINGVLIGDGIQNVTLEKLKFSCSASATLGKKISLLNTENLIIKDCEIENWYGTFARLNGAKRLTIENCYCKNSTGDTGDVGACFYVNGGENLNFNNIKSYSLSDNAIYIDGSNAVKNVSISGVQGEKHTGEYNPHVIGIYGNVSNVTINNVNIRDCDNGIRVAYRNNYMPQNISISNVNIYNAKYAGIDVRSDSELKQNCFSITNVTILLSEQDGIQLTNVLGGCISNCLIVADRNGILLTNTVGCSIANCKIENRSDHSGVAFLKMDADSNNNTVFGCVLYNKISGNTTQTGFQDLRTLDTRRNMFVMCRCIGERFLLNGYDIRTSVVLLPMNNYTPEPNSVMFGTPTDKPTAGLSNGVDLIDSTGSSNGWRYYNNQWVSKDPS